MGMDNFIIKVKVDTGEIMEFRFPTSDEEIRKEIRNGSNYEIVGYDFPFDAECELVLEELEEVYEKCQYIVDQLEEDEEAAEYLIERFGLDVVYKNADNIWYKGDVTVADIAREDFEEHLIPKEVLARFIDFEALGEYLNRDGSYVYIGAGCYDICHLL